MTCISHHLILIVGLSLKKTTKREWRLSRVLLTGPVCSQSLTLNPLLLSFHKCLPCAISPTTTEDLDQHPPPNLPTLHPQPPPQVFC